MPFAALTRSAPEAAQLVRVDPSPRNIRHGLMSTSLATVTPRLEPGNGGAITHAAPKDRSSQRAVLRVSCMASVVRRVTDERMEGTNTTMQPRTGFKQFQARQQGSSSSQINARPKARGRRRQSPRDRRTTEREAVDPIKSLKPQRRRRHSRETRNEASDIVHP